MKASELIEQLRLVAAHGVACGITKEAATMLERFIALADELEGTIPSRGDDYLSGRVDERLAIAKRLRKIGEGEHARTP